MIFEFNGIRPTIDPSAYVHSQATVVGDVWIGKDVYIAPHAVLRGDWGKVIVEDGCNVQENVTLHMFPGKNIWLKPFAHIGHGAVIHGATIGENTLVGMNSVVMDDCIIGKECIIGALSFVAKGTKIDDRKIVVGNPAKVVKSVSQKMVDWKTKGTELYQQLPLQLHQTLKSCTPNSPNTLEEFLSTKTSTIDYTIFDGK